MLKQIKELGTEKIIPDDTDIISIQQADGITRHITRANFLSSVIAASNNHKLIQILETKPNNTAGGTATAGSWIARPINLLQADETASASLVSSTLTLPAGKYFIDAESAFYRTGATRIRLQNLTNSTTLLNSLSTYIHPSQAGVMYVSLSGMFTLSVSNQLQLQYRCNTTSNTFGLGDLSNFSIDEIYSILNIWKQ